VSYLCLASVSNQCSHLGFHRQFVDCTTDGSSNTVQLRHVTSRTRHLSSQAGSVEAAVAADTVFGQPFLKPFPLCYRTVVLHVCPVCDVGVLWPNGWMDQDETWYACRPRPRRLCVTWGPSSAPQKGGRAPNFRPMFLVAKRLDGSRCHLVQK